jgi:hypothetical protein
VENPVENAKEGGLRPSRCPLFLTMPEKAADSQALEIKR